MHWRRIRSQSAQLHMNTVVDADHPIQTIKHPVGPSLRGRHAAAGRMHAQQGRLLVLPEQLVGLASRVRHAAHNMSVLWEVALNLPHREAKAKRKAPPSAPADWSGHCPFQSGCNGMRLSCRDSGSVARPNRGDG